MFFISSKYQGNESRSSKTFSPINYFKIYLLRTIKLF